MDAENESEGSGLIWIAIKRPTTVIVAILLTVFFGALSVSGIPIQLTPDVTVPTITVSTAWPGAAPVEVETEILEPQEEVLKSLQGLEKMESSASNNSGSITLEFKVGTPLEEALVRVTNRLSQVSSYPDAVREPNVQTADSAGPPIAVIAIRAPDRRSVAAYGTWARDEILPEIDRIPGVAGIRFFGAQELEVHIRFSAEALAARNVSIDTVAARVQSELRDRSAGDITLGKRRYLVRAAIAPEEAKDFERIVLGASDSGVPIVLGDVAEVRTSLRKPGMVALVDDQPSMVMLLSREAGTNVLEITREIHETVKRLQTELLEPEGLEIEILSDQVDYIEGALSLVQRNLLLGSFLAVVMLIIFLRSFGASAVISVAIPICVFATALGMQLFGRTINVVSLAGITFAVGMVVDNSIVSLESIDTWRGKVHSSALAAYYGIRDVWGAILASTLTTVAVFIPIVLWQGEVGELLRDVAVAIAVAVSVSLVVSVLIIPSLAAQFLSSGKEKPEPGRLTNWGTRFRDKVVARVQWLVASNKRALMVVVFAIVASLGATALMLPSMEYLPTGNRNLVFGIILPPPGYSIDELGAIGDKLQAEMTKHKGVEIDGDPALRRSFFVGSPDGVFAGAVAENDNEVGRVLMFIRKIQATIPGVFSFATQASLFGRGLGSGRAVELNIQGSDIATLTSVGSMFFGQLRAAMPGAQVRPSPTLDPGAPELQIVPRRKEAARLQMGGASLGLAVDALIDGAIIGGVHTQGRFKTRCGSQGG